MAALKIFRRMGRVAEAQAEELRRLTEAEFRRGIVPPQPRILHIETRARCNGSCGFCPASILNDSRKDASLPDALVDKILDELHEWGYRGRISLYNNNEPFLDRRIYDLVRKARERVPPSYLEIKTNGMTLDLEKVVRIFNCGLDVLYINDYVTGREHRPNVRKLVAELGTLRRFQGHLEGDLYFTRIKIYLRGINDVLGTRAGTSPNKKFQGPPCRRFCLRPFEMMTISPQGDVSVCSEDFLYSISLGSVARQTLREIWNSSRWNELRERLIQGDRSATEACSRCDYRGYSREAILERGLHVRRRSPLDFLRSSRSPEER